MTPPSAQSLLFQPIPFYDEQEQEQEETSLFSQEELADICFSAFSGQEDIQGDDDGAGRSTSRSGRDERREGEETASTTSTAAEHQHSERWLLRLQELAQFKEEYGHCSVPTYWPQNAKLAQWVKRQRYQYKLLIEGGQPRSSLTPERKRQLESLGFVWDAHGAFWAERYQELRDYREEHGHANIPASMPENPQLAIWAKCQRRQFKIFCAKGPAYSNMSWNRITKLAETGFSFDPRIWKRNQKRGSPLSDYDLLAELIPSQFLPTNNHGGRTARGDRRAASSTNTRSSTTSTTSSTTTSSSSSSSSSSTMMAVAAAETASWWSSSSSNSSSGGSLSCCYNTPKTPGAPLFFDVVVSSLRAGDKQSDSKQQRCCFSNKPQDQQHHWCPADSSSSSSSYY